MGLLGLAIALFASTNVDDIFLLVGFFADPRFRPRDIVTGQYAGITALFALALLGSLLALVISRAYIGLLGIVAIGLGTKRLFDLYRNREATEGDVEHSETGSHTRVATVALLTLANGADNLGIYMPAFAIRSPIEIGMMAVIFAIMTGLWCFFAHWMVNHPTFGKPIRRHGRRLAPLVLIAIGISIMYEAGSFGLLLRGRTKVLSSPAPAPGRSSHEGHRTTPQNPRSLTASRSFSHPNHGHFLANYHNSRSKSVSNREEAKS